MVSHHRLAFGVLMTGLLVAALGCGKDTPTSTPPGPPPGAGGGPPAGVSTGNALYDQHCLKCHTIDGIGGKGKGPDLSKIGSKPDRTAEWIAEHIKNPRVHKHGSNMPEFQDKLKPEEIKELAEFLAAKK